MAYWEMKPEEALLYMRNLKSRIFYDEKKSTWKLDGAITLKEWESLNYLQDFLAQTLKKKETEND